jgi:D-alanine-D-alanine ligase
MSTDRKLRIAVLFGGRSGEHDVSLMSARSVLSVLDPNKYDITEIGITKEGHWLIGKNTLQALEMGRPKDLLPAVIFPDTAQKGIFCIDGGSGLRKWSDIDVIFPVLHGTFGEDGTMQGLFELAGIAYVGAGVVGSAVGMDKGIFKDVMVANQIPVVDTMVVSRALIEKDMVAIIEQAERLSDYPLFTKPANLGSSVGIIKCYSRSDLQEGLMEAASFDRRILIQQGVKNAREIEVSVLGNSEPVASVPGEVLPSREFYSYESKYVDGTSGLQIPAELPAETAELIREYAVRAYKAIDCAGMARVDFFVEKDTNRIYINELNSLPGFTKISMYPKLWEASGLSYNKLVDCLIELAMERKVERNRTSYTYRSDT